MSDERLSAIIAKHKERQDAIETARLEREERQKQKLLRKKAVETAFAEMKKLASAISVELNKELSGAGLTVFVEDGKASSDGHQFIVKLDGTGGDRQLVFNVHETGAINPVVLIPHTGKSPSRFDIDGVDREKLRALILDFMEQAVSAK